MADTRFLIAGATGATDGAAAALLLDKGRKVRTFVHREDERSEALRKRGAEVVVGDLLDFGAVREALESVDRAYFIYPIRPGLVQATVQFAQSAIGPVRSSWYVAPYRSASAAPVSGGIKMSSAPDTIRIGAGETSASPRRPARAIPGRGAH
jgi:NmrA-like family